MMFGLRGMGASSGKGVGAAAEAPQAAPARQSSAVPVDSFAPAKQGGDRHSMDFGALRLESADAYGWHKLRQELINLVRPS